MLIDKPSKSEQAEQILGAIKKAADVHEANAKKKPIVFVATDVWEVLVPYLKWRTRTHVIDEVGEAVEYLGDRVRYKGLDIRHQRHVEAGIVIHVHPPEVEKWETLWAKKGEGSDE